MLLDRSGAQQLNEYQLSQLFTDRKLQEAARTRNPIRLMIGFDYPDAYGNSETLVPVNLTVLPEIQHNIKFFKMTILKILLKTIFKTSWASSFLCICR